MKAKKSAPPTAGGTPEVDAFMAKLDHPLKARIQEIRRSICGVNPAIAEAIKWNAPSFRTTDFFATTHLRAQDRVQLVFHRGAKVRADFPAMVIPDPVGMMKWLAKDRCLVTVGSDAKDLTALAAIVRAWIKYV